MTLYSIIKAWPKLFAKFGRGSTIKLVKIQRDSGRTMNLDIITY